MLEMNIKARFCAKCGEQSSALIDGYCSSCYFKEFPINLPQKARVEICVKCGAIHLKKLWVISKHPPEFYLAKQILSKIRVHGEERVKEVSINRDTAKLTIILKGKKFTKECPVNKEIKKSVCKDCSRQHGSSFASILQLRGSSKFIAGALKKLQKYHNKISKIEEKAGTDIYFITQNAARQVARDIKKEFKCTMKETARQHSWDKNKDRPMYRITILLRKT